MDAITELTTLMQNRETLYRLLGRLYRIEVDEELLTRLGGVCFPSECGDGELAEGYRLLAACLHREWPDRLNDLAADYARVFLGAGISEGVVAYPYESVYTSRERLIMQEARDRVLAAYRAKGLDKAETLELPEDHIALELEFMAHLCHDARKALAAGDWSALSASLQEQQEFLEQHQLNWVPDFCRDIQKCAATDFYRAVAKITNGYLALDRAVIVDLSADAAARAESPK